MPRSQASPSQRLQRGKNVVDGQAHDGKSVAVDSLDEPGAAPLCAVPTGTAPCISARDVCLDFVVSDVGAKRDPDGDNVIETGMRCDDRHPVAEGVGVTTQRPQLISMLLVALRFSVDPPVEVAHLIRADDHAIGGRQRIGLRPSARQGQRRRIRGHDAGFIHTWIKRFHD